MTVRGIDVSAYQSLTYDVDGLDFVFVKITEGLSYINPRWVAQRDRAKGHGLIWGAYHYPHMANDAVQEADRFLAQVAWKPGDVIVLDWEGYDSANKGVPRSRQVAYRDAWLKHVKGKMPGHRVGIYCNTDYWLNVDKTSTCGDFLWIATAGKSAGKPGIRHAWTFHQYSTAGGIDHDIANFPSRAALAAWAHGSAAQHQEDDMQINDALDLNTWVTKEWPKDAGLADKKITVETALSSGYAHSRAAHETSAKILAQVQAQGVAISELAKALGSRDTAIDVDALVARITSAIESIDVHLSVDQT